ncbi:protein kinase domain-containing protein [Streptomyces sp. NPDC001156]
MPHAELLNNALGDDATLLDVVTHITSLAGTLTALADRDIYHRDIKPANLFWYGDAPVLADFGIAAIAGTPAGLTRPGEKLGPANFIAPEMLATEGDHERADVYSLAKTLFILALPKNGPYPPHGTHRADMEEFSLWQHSGSPGLNRLLHLLEAATQYSVAERLTMAEFHDELRAWLAQYSADSSRFHARVRNRAYRMGFDVMIPSQEKLRRDTEETRRMMLPCIRRIAEALIGRSDAWSEEGDHTGGDVVLGDYRWEPNSEEGFVPDGGTLWMATDPRDGCRIVLRAILDYRVCFTAEAQQGGTPWTLGQQWGPTPWQRPRMPQTEAQVTRLTDDVVQWIAQHHPGHVPAQ